MAVVIYDGSYEAFIDPPARSSASFSHLAIDIDSDECIEAPAHASAPSSPLPIEITYDGTIENIIELPPAMSPRAVTARHIGRRITVLPSTWWDGL